MTIIRDRNAVSEASTADLVETYNAMTGKDIKKFSSRAAAENQTSNAIMLGEDRAAKLGVRPGAKIVAMTVAEGEAKAAAKARGATETQPEAPNATEGKGKPAGGLRERLAARAGDAPPNKPRPRPEKKADGVERGPKLTKVRRATGEALSTVREDSERGKVLGAIGKSTRAWSIDELTEAVGFNVRPACVTLVRLGHLERAE